MTQPQPGDLIDIGVDGLWAQINLRGAELWQWRDRDGVDLLWSGDPDIWSGRAPILFPIIGSLVGGVYRYRQVEYALNRHGFARQAMFSLVEHSAGSAVLRLEASEASRQVYPFEFQLDLRFTCSGGALEVAVSVRNLGDEQMPFSFGFHPALRWPLEPGDARANHALTFAKPELAPISRLDGQGLVRPERQPSPVDERLLDLRDELFVDDALIFTDLASRSVIYGVIDKGGQVPGRQHGRHIRVDFDNLPLLGVWTKPGAGYICIEPWQGLADPQEFGGDIFAKPGILALAPYSTWNASMVLSLVPAS